MTYTEKVKDLYQLINTGRMMEGFEKYYHQNVVMQEVGDEPRIGKDVNREYEIAFMGMIKDFHGAGVLAITANEAEQKTMVESWMDFTFQNGTRMKSQQVAVQTWEGNQIVTETFYHK
jgi:predicted DNA-binding protein YlxM (UPF0122 family)